MLGTKFSSWPSFSQCEVDAVSRVLLSNKVNYWTGEECRLFEAEFAEFADCRYAVAVSNGTVALDLAFNALGVGAGDEVIVTSRTFLASVSSIVNVGATPVFADVDLESQNVSAASIEKVISSKTRAIVCVHLAGWPCDMDPIMALADKAGLLVVEDCAQAHGAVYKGRSVGSIGHVGCWSFCQDKIMTTGGEGGMVTTNDEALWSKMWSFKDHGKSWEAVYERDHPAGFRWLHESFGTNWRMMEVQAVIGRIQLKLMSEWNSIRNVNQNAIWRTVDELEGVRAPRLRCEGCDCEQLLAQCVHAAYKCYVFIEPSKLNDGWDRDRIINAINARGVPCFSGSCSEVYLEKAFENTDFRPKERLPHARDLGETSVMLLVHPTLKPGEIQLTCDVLREVMQYATGPGL